MDSNLVEWSENVTPEISQLFTDMYNKYKQVCTGKPIEEIDFNGCFYLLSVYYMYLTQVKTGELKENPELPIDEIEKEYNTLYDKIYFDKLLYI